MIRQISQSVFARRFFLKTIHCGLTKRVRWGILKLRKRWISCTTDTKGKIPLERTAFSLLGDFPAVACLPPTEVSIKPLADVDADYICCDGLEYNEYVTHRWHPLSPSGMQDGRSSIPFFDRFRNLFSCIKSAKMMPQQLDKVWSLGYTKTAKALSKTLLDASHSAKIPRERMSPSQRGIFALR